MLPTVAGNLEPERIWRVDKGRGEQERVGKGGGGGPGVSLEESVGDIET